MVGGVSNAKLKVERVERKRVFKLSGNLFFENSANCRIFKKRFCRTKKEQFLSTLSTHSFNRTLDCTS